MDVNDCFENRTLRKVNPDKEKIKKSLEMAETKLDESKKLFSAGFYDTAVMTLYTAMFHAARSLLYRDGVQEKNHYSVYIYLRERYYDTIPMNLINFFDRFRDERHEIFYGFEGKTSKEEVEDGILDAEDFIDEIKKIHGRKNEL